MINEEKNTEEQEAIEWLHPGSPAFCTGFLVCSLLPFLWSPIAALSEYQLNSTISWLQVCLP